MLTPSQAVIRVSMTYLPYMSSRLSDPVLVGDGFKSLADKTSIRVALPQVLILSSSAACSLPAGTSSECL